MAHQVGEVQEYLWEIMVEGREIIEAMHHMAMQGEEGGQGAEDEEDLVVVMDRNTGKVEEVCLYFQRRYCKNIITIYIDFFALHRKDYKGPD